MATIATFAKNALLDAMLRATASSTYTVGQLLLADLPSGSALKYKTLGGSGAEFTTPASGETELVAPLLTTHIGNGTIANAGIRDTGGLNDVVTLYTMDAGLAGGGVDIVVDDNVITAAEDCTVTEFAIRINEFNDNGQVCINTALRNRMLEFFIRKNTAVFSAAGIIAVYSGLPPATAELEATGTLLWVQSTSTTTWAAASGGTISLAGPVTANAIQSGTPGYARFMWDNGGHYIIQGTCGDLNAGPNGVAFSFDEDTGALVAGNSYSIVNASILFS